MKKITNKSRFNRIQIEMLGAVLFFALGILKNIPITNSIPAWKAIMDKLQLKYNQIKDLLQQKSTTLKGYSLQKRQLKAELVEQTLVIVNAVYNYFLSIGDAPNAEKMVINKSSLERMGYLAIVNFAEERIKIISPIVSSLTNFDVTQEMVDDWQDTTTNLQNVLSLVKNFYKNRRTLNKNIQNLMRECMIILYMECDSFITSFKKENSDYYNDYLGNRKLQPLSEHTKFKVRIISDSGTGIYNAKIQQDGTDNFVTTDINGQATLKVKVKKGKDIHPVYSFTISSGSHSVQSGNVEIKLGDSVFRQYTIAESGFIIPALQETPQNQNA